MRAPRLDALVVLALATAAMILPFLDWYGARAPGGELRVSGVSGSPEVWVVAILAALTVVAALILAARPAAGVSRPVAIALVLVAVTMTAWSVEAYLRVPVTLAVDEAGTAREVSSDVWRRWPGAATAALSAGIALVGLLRAWPRRRP